MNIVEKINNADEAYENLKKELVIEAKANFIELFKEAFEKYPMIEIFGWTQYTPYFQDGDQCYFSTNSVDYLNGFDKYGEPVETYIFDDYDELSKEEVNLRKPILVLLEKIKSQIPDHYYEDMFGEDMRVFVSRDGTINTEKYEHD